MFSQGQVVGRLLASEERALAAGAAPPRGAAMAEVEVLRSRGLGISGPDVERRLPSRSHVSKSST
jgi:hypothetical protein